MTERATKKRNLRPYIVGGVFGMLGVLLLPVTGVLNFAADPEQSDLTDLYFRLASRQSIALRSFDLAVEETDDPAMVARAAGHYEMVCADCHGSPGGPPERFARDLSPQPPLLMEQVDRWRPDARLFWTIKHGIRRTAMPAWASLQRDDEVWDMVAFLNVMPQLSEGDYRAMAGRAVCADCHGERGEGRADGQPRLDIQTPQYLENALKAFSDGTRESGTMKAAAAQLDAAAIADLAVQYGKAVRLAPEGSARGAEIARAGVPEDDVAACDSCHGAQADPRYPRLSGQDADYLLNQLKLFMELGVERGGAHASIMAHAIGTLSEADMEAVADWYGQ